MCHKLINRSPDLKRLRDEGHELEIRGAHLLVHHVPYVNSRKEIAYGTLVSTLNLSAEATTKPETHVMHFIGEHPCNLDGSIIQSIQYGSGDQVLDPKLGLTTNHSFSNKPAEGYKDYYEKVTSYIRVIASQAEAIDPSVKAKTFKVIETNEPDSVFHYLDTNSSRGEIGAVVSKIDGLRIAIIGLGGTGSYVLDLVAKTPVREIHLFDGDEFLQHNAFRSPGAASIKKLVEKPRKVDYLHEIYSNMHKSIIPHGYYLDSSHLDELSGMDFVFICIDRGDAKKLIIRKLVSLGICWIDVGVGVQVVENSLCASVRVTTGTAAKHDHLETRIPMGDEGNDDYAKNIQIAELNSLNAALAVIKWKKLYGYYHDMGKEHHTVFDLGANVLVNDEIGA